MYSRWACSVTIFYPLTQKSSDWIKAWPRFLTSFVLDGAGFCVASEPSLVCDPKLLQLALSNILLASSLSCFLVLACFVLCFFWISSVFLILFSDCLSEEYYPYKNFSHMNPWGEFCYGGCFLSSLHPETGKTGAYDGKRRELSKFIRKAGNYSRREGFMKQGEANC